MRSEDGAAMVEAAIVFLLLCLLIMGGLDFSVYFWELNSANKAAHIGARMAIVSAPAVSGLTADWTQSPYVTELGDLCSSVGCPQPDVSTTCATACPTEIAAMQGIFPQLQSANVTIEYKANGLGFVGRASYVQSDVTVRINQTYTPFFLGYLFASLPIQASATLPSENYGVLCGSAAATC